MGYHHHHHHHQMSSLVSAEGLLTDLKLWSEIIDISAESQMRTVAGKG